jgi:hypothetical protein
VTECTTGFLRPRSSFLSLIGGDVGVTEGESVGVTEGESVGAAVGESVGAAVGESVGAAVGESVGTAVGESVGAAKGGCCRSCARMEQGRSWRAAVAATPVAAGAPVVAAPVATAPVATAPRQWRFLLALRSALQLSVVVAVVALVALPVEMVRGYLFEWSVATFGQGVCPPAMFLDRERYLRREPFTVQLDRSTPAARFKLMFLAYVGDATATAVGLFYFYIVFLGGTRKVWLCFGAHLALFYAIEICGYVLAAWDPLRLFAPVLILVMIYAALRHLCPRQSKVPWHVIKQVACFGLANLALTSLGRVDTVRIVACSLVHCVAGSLLPGERWSCK